MQRGVRRALLLFLVAAVANVSLATDALAQSIELPASIHRKQRQRPSSQLPNWVNRADCLARDVLTFSPVTLHDYGGYELEVWAGAHGVDCANPDNRDDGGSCFPVFAAKANASSMTVPIEALDLVARGAEKPDYPGVCNGATSKKRTALSLTFMLLDSDGDVGGKPQIWNDIGYDVSPPAPPTKVSASESETRIYLDFTEPDDIDLKWYRFYCDPAPGTEHSDGGLATLAAGAVSQAIDAEDASADAEAEARSGETDGGGDQGKRCADSTMLAAGADPTAPRSLDAYVCGSMLAGEHTYTVEHLVNGVDYSIAVASVDEVGNVGVLSRTVCEKPIPLTDFFELYRQAGGKAGGGLCSVARRTGATGYRTATLFAALSICAVLRRRTPRS